MVEMRSWYGQSEGYMRQSKFNIGVIRQAYRRIKLNDNENIENRLHVSHIIWLIYYDSYEFTWLGTTELFADKLWTDFDP